jgi:hypothetical protein
MYKIYFTGFLFLIVTIKGFSQISPVKDSVLADSALKGNRMEGSLETLSNKGSSYLQVGFGVGNQLYSLHNHALNSKLPDPPFAITPTITYVHKSGFSISANNYLLNENKTFGVNQYSVTPAYETLPGSNWDFLVSYTRYFVNNEYSLYSSPVQNDIYSSVVYKKTWLQPGFALDYSTGNSKEVLQLDTTINNIKRHLHDSITNELKSVATILSVEHNFGWNAVLNKNDSITFIPMFLLNLGSSATTVINNDNVAALLSTTLTKAQIKTVRTALQRRIKKLTRLQNTGFGAESLGMDLLASYTIGNFAIQPDVYLDYYLPQTNQKRFTQIFVVNFNYAF